MSRPFQREHYRIQYPAAARPRLVIEGRSCDVIDVSEHGVRFRLEEGMTIAVGDEIAGTVRFRRSETVHVMGTVLRIVGREAAAKLDTGVPLRIIIDEQRYLREHYRGMAW